MAGSAISFIGLPLVAVLVLRVSPVELGLISAVALLPPVVAGPFIGPLADRFSRHRLMLVADLGRAGLLALIPLAVLAGVLRLWLMVLVTFAVGVLTAVFNVAFPAFLPAVVPEDRLGSGNARLSASQSASGIAGPGLAAGLIALGGAATAVAADAFSYLGSAYALLRIRTRDAPRDSPAGAAGFFRDIRTGFTLLRRDAVLATVTRSNAIMACFGQLQSAVYFLFLTRTLHFGAATISLIFLASGALGLLSAIGCARLTDRVGSGSGSGSGSGFGFGRLVVLGQLVMALGGTCLALAQGSRLESAAFITAGEACFEVGLTLFGVGYVTLFQRRAADEVRGRVIGAAKFLSAASTPVAALIAGVLGTAFGLRATLVVGAAGMALGLAVVISPRVWRT